MALLMSWIKTVNLIQSKDFTLADKASLTIGDNTSDMPTIHVCIDDEITAREAVQISEIFAELAAILKQQESA